jgi:hypothetical protein
MANKASPVERPGAGIAGNLHRRQAVVTVELGTANDPLRRGDLGQWNHVATRVLDRQS